MESLDLRHLRMLCAIADTGSLRRAAVLQGYSQAAVSTQLQRIERFLGEPVFQRGGRGAVPTAFGAEVVTRARDILSQVETIGRPGGSGGGGDRVLRLAVTNTPILSGLVAGIRSAAPDLALTVSSVYSSSEIVEALEAGLVDAAVAVDYPGREIRHSADVTHRGIGTEPTFLAMAASHRLAQRLEVALTDLADEAWFLTPDDGAGWPGVFYDACESAGFTPAVVHEFLGDRLQLQGMIAQGLGVGPVQATFPPTDGVVVKPMVGTPVWCRYVLAWRTTVPHQDIETVFRSATVAYRDLVARSVHFQAWAARNYSSRFAKP